MKPIILNLYTDDAQAINQIGANRELTRQTDRQQYSNRYDIVCNDYQPLKWSLYRLGLIAAITELPDKTHATITIISGRKLLDKILGVIMK